MARDALNYVIMIFPVKDVNNSGKGLVSHTCWEALYPISKRLSSPGQFCKSGSAFQKIPKPSLYCTCSNAVRKNTFIQFFPSRVADENLIL